MIFGQKAGESDMVALFLKAELKSDRWGGAVRKILSEHAIPSALITKADTTNAAANEQRARVLGAWRGYRENRELFSDYPEDVEWHWVTVESGDFPRLKYIAYSYWDELTGGSRRPADATTTILSGREVFGVSNQWALDGAKAIRSGVTFDPIILVASDLKSDLVILEGHCRVTAYALAGPHVNGQIHALLGLSPRFESWR